MMQHIPKQMPMFVMPKCVFRLHAGAMLDKFQAEAANADWGTDSALVRMLYMFNMFMT
jgi:hypothetical protein